MNANRTRSALTVLQWVLGLVILAESANFAFSPGAAHSFAKTGLPNFIRMALAWSEMAAAVIFLIPGAIVVAGWLKIFVLACAIVLHLLHGWLDVGGLIVYVAGVWAVRT